MSQTKKVPWRNPGRANTSKTYPPQMSKNSNAVIYQNPAKNLINVFVKTTAKIKLVDLNGRVLIEKQSTPGLNTINTSQLSNGIYIVLNRRW